MRVSRLHAVILLLSGLCAACKGESSSPNVGSSSTTPATASDIEDLCTAQCERSERCSSLDGGAPEEPTPECLDSCRDKLDPLGASARADMIRALTDCTSELPCDTNDDICTDRAVTATWQSIDAAIHEPDLQACLEKQEECRDSAGAFSDDTCGSVLFLVDAKRAQAANCFDGACDALGSCLEPIFGP